MSVRTLKSVLRSASAPATFFYKVSTTIFLNTNRYFFLSLATTPQVSTNIPLIQTAFLGPVQSYDPSHSHISSLSYDPSHCDCSIPTHSMILSHRTCTQSSHPRADVNHPPSTAILEHPNKWLQPILAGPKHSTLTWQIVLVVYKISGETISMLP